ncbi:hypothetical protein EI427_22600 [Flammeovirga pectinis]|uniref:Uncharacterized protein n=1 Tax=Flammeovirga pectinis TaxID=2494373 RepID=A0A3Q9FPN5_9BACT|nr:hypothetical protein [Flammeovirga pectinis]AZQ65013.1 hypothetical protein EI427_22600 [Flammeovirga pectinis]
MSNYKIVRISTAERAMSEYPIMEVEEVGEKDGEFIVSNKDNCVDEDLDDELLIFKESTTLLGRFVCGYEEEDPSLMLITNEEYQQIMISVGQFILSHPLIKNGVIDLNVIYEGKSKYYSENFFSLTLEEAEKVIKWAFDNSFDYETFLKFTYNYLKRTLNAYSGNLNDIFKIEEA